MLQVPKVKVLMMQNNTSDVIDHQCVHHFNVTAAEGKAF